MRIQLKNARLAFANIFEPRAFDGKGKASFSASLIIPKNHPQIKEIKNALLSVANEKWGAKGATILKELEAKDKTCFHDGDTKSDYDGFPGNFYIAARSDARPGVYDRDGKPLIQADGRPYSGCYVYAIIDLWAQDNNYGKRINATLAGVKFYEDGDAFTGSAPATEGDFDDLSEEATEKSAASGLV